MTMIGAWVLVFMNGSAYANTSGAIAASNRYPVYFQNRSACESAAKVLAGDGYNVKAVCFPTGDTSP
jgi:hypothetical protein